MMIKWSESVSLYISSLLQQATTIGQIADDGVELYISSLLQQATTR